jgi:peptidoglycan/LPS O-acetylase OafA/YrhL
MKTKGKILYLESIRGIAALCVVIGHLILFFFPAIVLARQVPKENLPWIQWLLSRPPFPLFFNGTFSVGLFFVLSGFVLSYPYFKSFNPDILCSATMRRYFRLAIPVVFSVLICLFAWRVGLVKTGPASIRMEQDQNWIRTPVDDRHKDRQPNPAVSAALREGLFDAFFHFDEFHSLNPALWTIEIEFKGSLLIYAFLAIFARMRCRAVFYFLLAAGFYLGGGRFRYYSNFLMGCALCDYMMLSQRSHGKTVSECSWPLPNAFLVLVAGLLAGGILLSSTKFIIVHSLGSVMIIWAALKNPQIQGWLEWKPLIFLGDISFCLYLLHGVIIGTFGSSTYLIARKNGLSHFAGAGLASTVCLAVALPFSWLIASTVDRFAIAFPKKVYGKVFPNGAIKRHIDSPFVKDSGLTMRE